MSVPSKSWLWFDALKAITSHFNKSMTVHSQEEIVKELADKAATIHGD